MTFWRVFTRLCRDRALATYDTTQEFLAVAKLTQSGDQSFLIFCYFLSYSGILTYYPTNLKFKWSLWRPLSSSIHKNTAIYYKIIKRVNKRLQMIDNTVVHQIHEHLYERYTIRSITPVSEEGWREKVHKRPVYLKYSTRNIFQSLLGTLYAKWGYCRTYLPTLHLPLSVLNHGMQ